MKKFVFSLENILRYKRQLLDVLKSEMSNLQMDIKEIESQIQKLESEFGSLNQSLVSKLQDGLTAQNFAVYKKYMYEINEQIKLLGVKRENLLIQIVSKKQEIINMNSDISGLERLKDKQLQEYLKQSRKEQELSIEEFVSRARCPVG